MKVVRSGAGVFALALVATVAIKRWPELTRPKHVDLAFRVPSPLELVSLPAAARFDFPLGSENAAMSYNAATLHGKSPSRRRFKWDRR